MFQNCNVNLNPEKKILTTESYYLESVATLYKQKSQYVKFKEFMGAYLFRSYLIFLHCDDEENLTFFKFVLEGYLPNSLST